VIKDPSQVMAVAELAAAEYVIPEGAGSFGSPSRRDVWKPAHLHGRDEPRIASDRHAGRTTWLRFDGSAAALDPTTIRLAAFDDGVSQRAGAPGFLLPN
jgi:hypothetical protein